LLFLTNSNSNTLRCASTCRGLLIFTRKVSSLQAQCNSKFFVNACGLLLSWMTFLNHARCLCYFIYIYIYIYVDLVFVLPPRAATPIDGFTQPADRFDGSDLAAANILQTSKILTSWKGDSEFVSRLWQQVVRRRA
jgi:hypothetical protein